MSTRGLSPQAPPKMEWAPLAPFSQKVPVLAPPPFVWLVRSVPLVAAVVRGVSPFLPAATTVANEPATMLLKVTLAFVALPLFA